ncbi:unnamed protein product [Fraxinus pennsylvanica]|uniref:Uncharacterized protein n=1 Tax=Fraxinus pennsylvanica TaxID=56036 RepID=A0AAD1ZJQ7_9LAMI|nr:unnamed protein product [Fraxinus pennsylvanica]
MSTQICASAAPISTKNVGIENARRSVTYHPSIWGDYFLAYTSDLTDIFAHEEQEHQRLKEEVKKHLAAVPDDSLHKLDLIDSIQRLGVAAFIPLLFDFDYLDNKGITCHVACSTNSRTHKENFMNL